MSIPTAEPLTPMVEAPRHYLPEEYLAMEVAAAERHEYRDGKIMPRVANTPNHNKLAGNLCAAIHFALKRQPYEVYMTDQRLWIPDHPTYTYPDVMVVAQPLVYAPDRRDTLTNPLLIIEILSPSTAADDRGSKFALYRTIPTFQEYVLVEQDRIYLEQYTKTNDRQWLLTPYTENDAVLTLDSLDLDIAIADIYDKVAVESV
ncbi:Uma2 family endonuclease [Trichothermofontia sp.]